MKKKKKKKKKERKKEKEKEKTNVPSVVVKRQWKHKPLSRHWQRYDGATCHGGSSSTSLSSLWWL